MSNCYNGYMVNSNNMKTSSYLMKIGERHLRLQVQEGVAGAGQAAAALVVHFQRGVVPFRVVHFGARVVQFGRIVVQFGGRVAGDQVLQPPRPSVKLN